MKKEKKANHPIKKLRLKLKKNQLEFSEMMGVTQGTLSRIENGFLAPTVGTLNKLHSTSKFSMLKMVKDIADYDEKENE